MATFHPFPRLPAELRAQIWEATVEPRTVDVRIVCRGYPTTRHLVSSTPVPASLQTCREARHLGLYERKFTDIAARLGHEERYVWLNLGIDIVDISSTRLEEYQPALSTIKRLKFERDNTEESWYHFEKDEMRHLTSVVEIQVICVDGLWGWAGAIEDGDFPWPESCPIDKLIFIDKETGQIADGTELEDICKQIRQEMWNANADIESGGDII